MPAGSASPSPDPRPLVLHIVYRFDVGGLENGVVNLINHMPREPLRHAVLAVDRVEPSFAKRIRHEDVQFHQLNKPPGHGFWQYPRIWRLLRELKPAVVHTRNLAALEAQVPAWLAGTVARIHSEHGRDVEDLDGTSKRHQRMRRLYKPFVHRYVALSRDLEQYLLDRVGVPRSRVQQIYNGVDAARFQPRADGTRTPLHDSPFNDPQLILVGTVGRMQTVKDQTLLARAFARVQHSDPRLGERLRLVMVGDGPLRDEALQILREAGVADRAWLPGERGDIPQLLQSLDLFVLPSRAEGISNTILEAMACGLPVVATRVGGNADLVEEGHSGLIVNSGDEGALADAIATLGNDAHRRGAMGRRGREVVEQRFSLDAMVAAYQQLYLETIGASKPRP